MSPEWTIIPKLNSRLLDQVMCARCYSPESQAQTLGKKTWPEGRRRMLYSERHLSSCHSLPSSTARPPTERVGAFCIGAGHWGWGPLLLLTVGKL